jgi:hypothetical protein
LIRRYASSPRGFTALNRFGLFRSRACFPDSITYFGFDSLFSSSLSYFLISGLRFPVFKKFVFFDEDEEEDAEEEEEVE